MRALLPLVVVVLFSCGAQRPTEDAGPLFPLGGGGGGSVDLWQRCQVPTRFELTAFARDGGCGPAPLTGALASLEPTTVSDGVLRWDGLALPVSIDSSCQVHGASCEAADAGSFRAETLTLRADQQAWVLSFSGERWSSYSKRCEEEGTARLTEAPDCLLAGTWELDAPPALQSGACGTTWSGPLQLSDGMGRFGSTELSGALDLQACSASLSHGDVDAGDFWSWNGALRTARVTVHAEGQGLSGTIEDQLEGTAFGGVTCPGGTFAFTASRSGADAGVEPWPVSCEASRPPFTSGNGVCEADAGETCAFSDCRCTAAGTACVMDRCAKQCSTDDGCEANERCSAGFCAPQGPTGEDGACTADGDCQRGLACGAAAGVDGGVCETQCEVGIHGACRDDQECRGRSCFTLIPVGGVCTRLGDCVPVNGQRSCAGSGGVDYCSRPCGSASECPATLPRCSGGLCFPP